jgi:hypothetical protein
MKFRLTRDWLLGKLTVPAGTVFDFSNPKQKAQAQGRVIPISAQPLDEESWREQLQLYGEQHRHLLGGGWQ